jgi:hypothetical protein
MHHIINIIFTKHFFTIIAAQNWETSIFKTLQTKWQHYADQQSVFITQGVKLKIEWCSYWRLFFDVD